MLNLRFIVALGLLLCSLMARAIVVIDDVKIAVPEDGFSGQFYFSLEGKSGNTKNNQFDLGTRLLYKQGKNVWLNLLSSEYGEDQHVKNEDAWFWHGRWAYELTDTHAWELFAQWEQDEFKRLHARSLAGFGHRWRYQSGTDYLNLFGLGFFYSEEHYSADELAGLPAENWYVVRMNTYWTYKQKINETVELANTLYVQPNIEQVSDMRLLDSLICSIKATDALAVTFSLTAEYDSEAPDGVKQTDISYKTGLQYRF